jgi:NADPH:quinone reductase-like Zn-dependent oxidoreductase
MSHSHSIMRYALARSAAGIDAISIETSAIPQPKAGEALVRIKFATLNFRDYIFVKGLLPNSTRDTYVPMSCGAGEVIAIGAGVTRVKVGDRVAPTFDQGWVSGGMESRTPNSLGAYIDGVARDYGVFAEVGLSLLPDEISDIEAATLPCAALTAWNALFVARATQPGDVVVVQGTGGVSIAALQFAKAAGATVIVTSSSNNKLARARALGADHVINYRNTPDWTAAVRALTHGVGAHVVVDVVGASQLQQSASALRPGGLIAAIGMLGGSFSWSQKTNVQMLPIAVGNRDQFEAMLRAIAANHIRPVVDQVYPLERLQDALRHMESGKFFGKIGITMS